MEKYLKFIFTLFVIAASSRADDYYDRKKFKHWNDHNKDCRNKRAEILQERSLVKVEYRVRKNGKRCTVKSGKWNDFYINELLFEASEVDIDHVVPLKEAWDFGASSWDAAKRETFANDSENLVITNRKYNRKKGAHTPLSWLPIDRQYACKYMKKWIYIKKKYQLKIKQKLLLYYKQAKCEEKL